MQNQFENPKSVRVSRFVVGLWCRQKSVRSLSARPHKKLAKAALSVSTAFRILCSVNLVTKSPTDQPYVTVLGMGGYTPIGGGRKPYQFASMIQPRTLNFPKAIPTFCRFRSIASAS